LKYRNEAGPTRQSQQPIKPVACSRACDSCRPCTGGPSVTGHALDAVLSPPLPTCTCRPYPLPPMGCRRSQSIFSSSRSCAARLCSFAAALLFSPPHQREAVVAPPQATGHRVAPAPPSSLSEAILKPPLQASPKRRPLFAPIDAKDRQHQPSTTILRASRRRRVVHLSSELLTDPANRASDPFLGPSPSIPAGQAMPPWNPPSW
jgi:hypothetical protein